MNVQRQGNMVLRNISDVTEGVHFFLSIKVGEHFFYLSGFSLTKPYKPQHCRGREGNIFYSALPLPPGHKHSDIYLQLCT